ncbi:hypothetical protein H0H81_009863 [Sphagnurus paluster]|uniref:Uncharacterized protein n=1 Tax=Sphagnurus paluster TaxID=117069 RepID=A0A9P7FRD3_9AGAR|nr:hypothetical protein H0H81_009863 [Sphagnurus paluster]
MSRKLTLCKLLLDGGKVVDYLKNVKKFLDSNPNEVLTLLFTNPEGLSVKSIWKPVFDAAGITPHVYIPPVIPMPYDQWPTLGEMITTGKRVVVFLDSSTDTSLVEFILPEFAMVKLIWETPFTVTNASFPCSIDRIHGPLAVDEHMYMINHSLNKNILDSGLIISDPLDAPITNSLASIVDHSNRCSLLGAGRAPTFVLLDYVDIGQGFAAADELNGLSVTP